MSTSYSSSAPNFCHSHPKAKDSQPQTLTLEFVQSTLSHRNTFNFFFFFRRIQHVQCSPSTWASLEGIAGKSNAASELQLCQCPPPSPQPTSHSRYSRIKTGFINCLENISKTKTKQSTNNNNHHRNVELLWREPDSNPSKISAKLGNFNGI